MTTSYDIVAAHIVEEMLVQVLVFAELPHCFIGKERSSEGDVVHFEIGILAKELEKVKRRYGRNSTTKGMPTCDDCLAACSARTMENVLHSDSLLRSFVEPGVESATWDVWVVLHCNICVDDGILPSGGSLVGHIESFLAVHVTNCNDDSLVRVLEYRMNSVDGCCACILVTEYVP